MIFVTQISQIQQIIFDHGLTRIYTDKKKEPTPNPSQREGRENP